jgi:hypothetical protein
MCLALAACVSCFSSPAARGQGTDTGTDTLSYGGFSVDQVTYLEIDDDFSLYAYSDSISDDWGDLDFGGVGLSTELDLTENGSEIDSNVQPGDGGEAFADLSGVAGPDSAYQAAGIPCYIAWGYGSGYYYQGESGVFPLGEVYAWVSTGGDGSGSGGSSGPPYIEQATVVGSPNGSVAFGEFGQIVVTGENLMNSDGSFPSLSYWYQGNLVFQGIEDGGTSSSFTADYQVPIPNPLSVDLGYIILDTDLGETYGPDQTIGFPPASDLIINPSVWQAGTTTAVTVTGTNLGSNPTFSVVTNTGGTDVTLTPVNGPFPGAIGQSETFSAYANVPGSETGTSAVVQADPGYSGLQFQCGGPGCDTGGGAASTVVGIQQPPYPEVTIIGWINANAIQLPGGENSNLQSTLNNSSAFARAECDALLAAWALGSLPYVNSPADVAYANAWLLKNSGNPAPPTPLPAGWASGGNFRLFNDFQINSSGTPLIHTAQVGNTPDPCGVLPALAGQAYFPSSAGETGATQSSGNTWNTWQLAEGRVGIFGQAIGETLNGTSSIPWIYSVAEFNSSGGPAIPPITALFPTYSIYINGTLYTTYPPQVSVSTFAAMTETTSQEQPSQIP